MTIHGFHKIVIVCSHGRRKDAGKKRVIDRLSWLETDPDDERAFRASMESRGSLNEDALQVILMNDRFGRREKWTNKVGREVQPVDSSETYWAGTDVVERTRALGGYRFKCRCGEDRPTRQSTLDKWIRERLAEDETRRVHEFDISV